LRKYIGEYRVRSVGAGCGDEQRVNPI
jgi:hypothetical protein